MSLILCQRNNWFDPFYSVALFYFLSFLSVCVELNVEQGKCWRTHTYKLARTYTTTVNYILLSQSHQMHGQWVTHSILFTHFIERTHTISNQYDGAVCILRNITGIGTRLSEKTIFNVAFVYARCVCVCVRALCFIRLLLSFEEKWKKKNPREKNWSFLI